MPQVDAGLAVVSKYRLLEQGGDPAAPAVSYGYLYCKSDGLYYEDSSGNVFGPLISREEYIYVRDKKVQNTDGGTFTSGAWRTRDINEEVSDTGNNCSIASNQITLDAGTYRCLILCPSYDVGQNQARLYNITDAAVELLGTNSYGDGGADTPMIVSTIVGRFAIAASKVFEIQHRGTSTVTTNGFGIKHNFNDEIYTIAEFWKES